MFQLSGFYYNLPKPFRPGTKTSPARNLSWPCHPLGRGEHVSLLGSGLGDVVLRRGRNDGTTVILKLFLLMGHQDFGLHPKPLAL